MNDYDLASAANRYDPEVVPNRARLVIIVTNLAEWANRNSDGWCYWPKPCRAAATAIGHIESTAYPEYDRRQREDISDAEMTAALRPIKAFLTRARNQGMADTNTVIPGRLS